MSGVPTNIYLPTLKNGQQPGRIFGVYVEPGQSVQQGDILFSYEDGEVIREITAPADGMVNELFIGETDPIASRQRALSFAAVEGMTDNDNRNIDESSLQVAADFNETSEPVCQEVESEKQAIDASPPESLADTPDAGSEQGAPAIEPMLDNDNQYIDDSSLQMTEDFNETADPVCQEVESEMQAIESSSSESLADTPDGESAQCDPVLQPRIVADKPDDVTDMNEELPTHASFSPWQIIFLLVAVCAIGLVISEVIR
ncbi:biotin/lipoyl-containing protein [Thalassotalea mangrovi]|uniref:Lipoyl-binding domain-containing protein n=1 Tax=Thalassotalea mangrovi TaxID=2572245 RepID=A0A4U1B606_9GAMM|nr:biotin/lipoyl-binding protein [Thalassotalea mangrovi]TKB45568.1 hypothetical protein E8M12_08195 [Thalassotalea mangrovi]